MNADGTLDVGHLEMAEVLRRLYNASGSLGLGRLHFTPEEMTLEQAQKVIDTRMALVPADAHPDVETYIRRHALYFDYLQGRVMKINLAERRDLMVRLYDRDNGEGAAARALGIETKEAG
jgi:hypothetical protein